MPQIINDFILSSKAGYLSTILSYPRGFIRVIEAGDIIGFFGNFFLDFITAVWCCCIGEVKIIGEATGEGVLFKADAMLTEPVCERE